MKNPKTTETTPCHDLSKIVLPRPWPLTEHDHTRLAHNLPKYAEVFSYCVVRILAAYDIGPQSEKKKDVAELALKATSAVDAFVSAMRNISLEEYPNAKWLKGCAETNNKNGGNGLSNPQTGSGVGNSDFLQKIALKTLKSSPYWTKKTRNDGTIIKGLICPACGNPNSWALTEWPMGIRCKRIPPCGGKAKMVEIFPELILTVAEELGGTQHE